MRSPQVLVSLDETAHFLTLLGAPNMRPAGSRDLA
jgi:hypothetical protein